MAQLKSETGRVLWESKSGANNDVLIDRVSKKVYKTPINKSKSKELAARVWRLWNKINPDLPKAVLYSRQTSEGTEYGVECPCIEGRQAFDAEIARELLEIYIRTGRIVLDPTMSENFLTRTGDNKIICVDVEWAIDLESRPGKRRGSVSSFNGWAQNGSKLISDYEKIAKQHPKTISLVRALLLIKLSEYDIDEVGFLRNNVELITQLSQFFHLLMFPIGASEEKAKAEVRALLKQYLGPYQEYQRELNHYVTSGGEELESFKAGLSLRFFGRSVVSGSIQESSPKPATSSLREA